MKNYQKNFIFLSIGLIAVLLNTFSFVGYTAAPIRVVLDGNTLSFDAPPFIQEGRTLVPFRVLLQSIGATVNWEPETQRVTASKSGMNLTLTIGSREATVNGQSKTLDVPAQINNGRTFVPLRFVSENLGLTVSWVGSLNQIQMSSAGSANTVNTGANGPVDKIFTLEELKKFHGQNGNSAYVAVDGIVYDVTSIGAWKNGMHNGISAGNDLSEAIKNTPHGKAVLQKLPVVGKLK